MDEAAGGRRKLSLHLPAANWEQPLPTLEAGQAIRLPIQLRAQDVTPGERRSIISVFTDLGTKTIVPIIAMRDDNL